MFEKGKADWLSELPSVITQKNNTIHHSKKMTPNQASKKSNERKVYTNLQDRRDKQKPKYKLGQLVRTADIKRVFSKGDIQRTIVINYIQSQKLYTTPSLAIELTICPRDIMKIYYYLLNYLLKKTILL